MTRTAILHKEGSEGFLPGRSRLGMVGVSSTVLTTGGRWGGVGRVRKNKLRLLHKNTIGSRDLDFRRFGRNKSRI